MEVSRSYLFPYPYFQLSPLLPLLLVHHLLNFPFVPSNLLFEKTVQTLNKISAELDGANPENANKVGSAFRNMKVAEAFAINDAFLQGQFLQNDFGPRA